MDGAVNHHAHKQAVKHRHHRRLGGREPTGAHAAQNQDRRGQTPGGFFETLPKLGAGQARLQSTHLVLARHPHGGHDQRQTGQDAGDHAGGKQRWHRSAGHQDRIDDKGDGRRNQNIGGRRCTHHAGRKRRRVPRARHGGDHHRTHRRRIGRTGAGNTAQEHGHHNRHQRQHTGAAADNSDCKVNQPERHARAVKDGADQHKHGNGQQRVLAQSGIKVLRHGQEAKPLGIRVGQRDASCACQTQCRANGHAHQHHDHKGHKQEGRDHG